MTLIKKTDDFLAALVKLPKEVRRLFVRQEAFFTENWLDPRLHTKRLKDLPGVYSIRITRRYRALFYFRSNEAIFFAIGHRKKVYE